MKNFTFALITLFTFVCSLNATDSPLWLRYSSISPDGKNIAFCYQGDIFIVPVSGGKASQLTTHPSYDTRPVWSPDGKNIAFSSDRQGGFDVYVVSAQGGVPKRLTTHSGNEYVETFLDNGNVLYQSFVQPDINDGQFPSGTFSQIYRVGISGGRPEMFSSMVMEGISINSKGELLYYDRKGYEDQWRKHHQSPITRDIWLTQTKKERTYKKLSSFKGEVRNPVWAPDEKSYYYLSEEKGSFNVFKTDPVGTSSKQITSFSKNPVRFLSVATDGTLCYSFDGEIYAHKENEKPRKVNIQIITDKLDNDINYQTHSGGATGLAVSPEGKEVAFIMRGDVYVTSVDYETTKRITNTPQQERNLCFSPDGRTLIYSSERNGIWGIYKTELVRESDKSFVYAQELKETPLIVDDKEQCFQPVFSPDGKEIAFLANRTEIRIYNVESKKIRTVLDGKFNYSYADGDQWFEWSPDSKWLLTGYIGIGGWNNKDIALVKADGRNEVTNLTESGYTDTNGKWALGGKAVVWVSDRSGFRSHGSWGAHSDYYIMFFDAEAYNRFTMSKEEVELEEAREKDRKEKEKKEKEKEEKEKKEKDKKDKKKDSDEEKKDDKEEKKDDKETLSFDLENRKYRIVRLTNHSSNVGDAILSSKGDKFYYQSAFEGGHDLWERNLKDNSTKIIVKGSGGGRMYQDKDAKYIFMNAGSLKRIEISNAKVTNISFRAPFDYRPYGEREYIFQHAWQQVKDKFYVTDLHGVDWLGYRKVYEKFLPYINNNYDFAEMLSEMLGELNASHTGARYYGSSARQQTGVLGVFYDISYTGDGLKIQEIIKNSPLDNKKTKIKVGAIIEKIDGEAIEKGKDYYPLFNGKNNRKVLLSVYDPDTKERFEEEIKLISQGSQNELLYKRWVEQRREMTDKLSNGKIGYVHVRGMDRNSFRDVYSDILGLHRNKEAVIVDTRHNGGGWLHNDLAILLSGKEFQQYVPRGQYIGSDPYSRWYKPSAVLVCENNYSNAHGFPFMYRELGIGKVIGTPIAGTMTAVWWENQIDPGIVFGIPQVAIKDMQGNYLENQEMKPDIEVYNEPGSLLKGEDQQLKKAVETLLKDIK